MSGTTFSSFEGKERFLLETVMLTQDFVSDILISIATMESFELKSEFHWNREVTKLTNDISQFVEITTLISKAVMQFKKHILTEIKSSHIHLLFIIKGMNQAQQKQDMVALEDLIKYELKDNLTQWKIDLIPQIKRLLNT